MRLVRARRWDIYSEPFENTAAFERYLNDTSSTLLAVAAHSLGDAETTVVTNFGYAMGLARFLQAVPKLIAAGRHPLTGFCSADLNEFVEEARNTYRDNYPNTPILDGDIKELEGKDFLEIANIKEGELELLDG